MIRANVREGRIETLEPIPEEWEGLAVKIIPVTPDDPILDLEDRLNELERLGPVEYEPGEQEYIAQVKAELKRLSLEANQTLANSEP